MKNTIKNLEKRIWQIEDQIKEINYERKDTSYRRKGGYFGTKEAYTSDSIIIETINRTRYLNTYICIRDNEDNRNLLAAYNSLKKLLKEMQIRKANRNLSKKADDVIKFGKYDAEKNPDGQYFSAGVYRVVFDVNGNVLASVFGGFYGSTPNHVDTKKWRKLLEKKLMAIPNAHIILKADGSCGDLFLRDYYDFDNVKIYDVPKFGGGFHTNIQVI